ncbi:hypothetical protein PVJ1_00074 [Psychrobacillus phage PVJ1]|nr:hypothetical protein PVJ1_00074 [Psychrobacillus phage PVJ1]
MATAKNDTSKKKKVVFNSNVKYGEELVKKGSEYEVSESEYEGLLEAGIIQTGKGD